MILIYILSTLPELDTAHHKFLGLAEPRQGDEQEALHGKYPQEDTRAQDGRAHVAGSRADELLPIQQHSGVQAGQYRVRAVCHVDVYKRIINGRYNGYATNGRRCPTVGVSGYLMGAGIGPFSRGLGLGSDSVIAITVVTAAGDLITVSEKDDKNSEEGQLFWALRGAGGGNFGVVVQWQLRLDKLQDPYGRVTAGRYVWAYRPDDYAILSDEEQAFIEDQLKSTMSSYYAYSWPDRITIDTTWVRQAGDNLGTQVGFISYCDGDREFFQEHMDRAIKNFDINKQLKRRCMEEKSSRFLHETLAAQWNEETVRLVPSSTQFRLYSGFAVDNANAMENMNSIIIIVKEELDAFGDKFNKEQAECAVSFIHAGGVARRKEPQRDALPWVERDMRGFLARFKARLRRYTVAGQAVFVNFPDAALADDAYECAYYGGNAAKLRKIKHDWNPNDFFRWSQSVRLPDKKTLEACEEATEVASGPEDDPPAVEKETNDEDLTDIIATKRWESRFDVPTSEFLNANSGLYPQLEPGARSHDIEWLYQVT
ncbi:hypothetical protein PG994_004905 [Apiospora phragmitis]|uniref:Berberine/berberine-like domain-containing protein n=1 Tax=Apiospora phragmitis TaxID=2905665 RepID=A0ABR1VRX8_9PEZI